MWPSFQKIKGKCSTFRKKDRNQQANENRQAGTDITSLGENHSIYLTEVLCMNQILVSQAQVKDIDVYGQKWKILPIWLIEFHHYVTWNLII